jgi:hypothetical protein
MGRVNQAQAVYMLWINHKLCVKEVSKKNVVLSIKNSAPVIKSYCAIAYNRVAACQETCSAKEHIQHL